MLVRNRNDRNLSMTERGPQPGQCQSRLFALLCKELLDRGAPKINYFAGDNVPLSS